MTYSPECVAAFEAKFGGAPEGCERTATGYAPNKYYAYPEAQMHNAKLEAFAANWERVKELEQREAVADGWKLAPVEPTEAMLDVACGTGCILSYQEAWRAMMSVVPAPPSTAEARARALVEFAMELKQLAQRTNGLFSAGLLHAATYAEAEAKRIREEGK